MSPRPVPDRGRPSTHCELSSTDTGDTMARPECTLALATLFTCAVLTVGSVETASAEDLDILPNPQLTIGTGIAGWHAESCRCFDRYGWDLTTAIGLQWHHLLGLEGGVTAGGMIFPKSGFIPYLGWLVGYRGHLVPPPRNWWQNVYVRAGFTRVSVSRTRIQHIEGGYLRGGWSLHLWGPIHADTEVGFKYFPGVMENFQLGVRGAVRLAF